MERIIPVIAPCDKIYQLCKVYEGWWDDGRDSEYEIIPVYVYSVHQTPNGIWVDVNIAEDFKSEQKGCFRYDQVWNKEYFLTEQEAIEYKKGLNGKLL